jgi:hypothetical protein
VTVSEDMPELSGLQDAALILGCTKQWVYEVLKVNRGAPEPVARLKQGPVYVKADLLRFMRDPERRPVWPEEWPEEWALAGRADLAEILGVGATRIDTRMQAPGAPAPVVRLRSGRVWLKSAALQFLEVHGSMSHPRYDVDIVAAKALYAGGMDLAPLAARFRIPGNVLRTRLVEAGVTLRTGDLRKPRKPLAPDERTAIAAALAQPDATPYSVGKQFGRSPITVQRIALAREQEQTAAPESGRDVLTAR